MALSAREQGEQFGQQETQRRLKAALRGAFSGPPTPLKDIPKRNGESRSLKVHPKRKKK